MPWLKRLIKYFGKRKKQFFFTALALFISWIVIGSQLWIKPGFTARSLIRVSQPSNDSVITAVDDKKIQALLDDPEFLGRFILENKELLGNDPKMQQFRAGIVIQKKYDIEPTLELYYSDMDPQQAIDKLSALSGAIIRHFQEQHQKKVNDELEDLALRLRQAKKELDSVETDRYAFKKEYPWVTLQGDAESAIQHSSYLLAQKLKLENDLAQLRALQTRLTDSDQADRSPILQDMIELVKSISRGQAIAGGDAINNPRRVTDLADSVLSALNLEIKALESRIAQERIYKFSQLPEKQTTLAEIERRYKVAEDIYTNLLKKYRQTEIRSNGAYGPLKLASQATIVKSKTLKEVWLTHGLMGFIGVLFLSLFLVMIPQALKGSVQDEADIVNHIPLPVLIKIPEIGEVNGKLEAPILDKKVIDKKLITADYTPSPPGEAFRNLRSKILFSNGEEKLQSLFITSTQAGEGKSLSAANIAITIAQQKIQTLLVDADLRRGLLHNLFGLDKEPGFSDFLYSQADVTEKNMKQVIRKTHVPNLFLLTAGKPIPNPAEMIGSKRFKDMMAYFVDRFGFVLLDTPPIALASDAYIISTYLDGGLLVVRQGLTKIKALRYSLLDYPDFMARFRGVLLNYADMKAVNTQPYSYYNY